MPENQPLKLLVPTNFSAKSEMALDFDLTHSEGAKTEIYDIIRNLADEGDAVAVFSSELEEVLGICDRIFLLFSGSLEDEIINGPNVDAGHILNVVTGGYEGAQQ